MSILLILGSGLLAAPQPSADQTRQLLRDYPAQAVREGKSAASLIRIGIKPDGSVFRCDTVAVEGDEKLGSQACQIYLRGRLKFTPAVNAENVPSYGLYTTLMKYFLPGTRQGRDVEALQETPDLKLTLATLPAEYGSLLAFKVVAQVARDGTVTACEGDAAAPSAFAEAACHSLKEAGFSVFTDESGRAVEYVTSLKVQMTADANRE